MNESEILERLLGYFYGEDLKWSFMEDVGIEEIDKELYENCKKYIEKSEVTEQ